MSKDSNSIPQEVLDAFQRARADGFGIGWKAGWMAAIDYLKSGKDNTFLMKNPFEGGASLPKLASSGPRKIGRPDLVLRILKSTPGATPQEVLEQAIAQGDVEAKSTTISTTLHRLKVRTLVRNKGGKWYLEEK